MKSLLEEAHDTVHSKRNKEYGSYIDNITTTCDLFRILRHKELSTEDGTYFLICLKLAREATRHKRDNLRDWSGYTELLDELLEEGLTVANNEKGS